MSREIRSYVAFKRACSELLPISTSYRVARLGGFWMLIIFDEWATVCGRWYLGYPKPIEDFVHDTLLVQLNDSRSASSAEDQLIKEEA